MPNRYNMRCPHCGSRDEIIIEAFVSVRLTGTGAGITDARVGPENWTGANSASCDACDYLGDVKDFEPSPARLVFLDQFRRRR